MLQDDATPNRHRREQRRRVNVVIPMLVAVAIATAVLTREVPAVGDWVESVLHPDRWAARQACRNAAFSAASHPRFARLLEGGKAHSTQEGWYIDGILIGEMAENGAETAFLFTCYLDSSARVVRTHRQPRTRAAAPHGPDNADTYTSDGSPQH